MAPSDRLKNERSFEYLLQYVYSFYGCSVARVSGRDRSRKFLELSGLRRGIEGPPVVRVTGTNGKGTLVTLLEHRIRRCGYNTIVLTSPHCYSVRERVRLNGASIAKDTLVSTILSFVPVLEAMRNTQWQPKPTDIWTWVAFYLHATTDQGTYAIYEVGKGGGSDVVNVFSNGLVGLTNIGSDHLSDFGGTTGSLLLEKLGLCSHGDTLFHGPLSSEHVAIVNGYCAEHSIPVISCAPEGAFEAGSRDEEDRRNTALCNLIATKLNLSIGAAVPVTPLSGRIEIRDIRGRRFVLDGGHNKEAIDRLVRRCSSEPDQKRAIIFGCQTVKDWHSIVEQLIQLPHCPVVLCVSSTSGEGVHPVELSRAFQHAGKAAQSFPGMISTLSHALTLDWNECIVTGSFKLFRDFDLALHKLGLGSYAVPVEDIDPWQPWMRQLC